jgi:hypothetical protein
MNNNNHECVVCKRCFFDSKRLSIHYARNTDCSLAINFRASTSVPSSFPTDDGALTINHTDDVFDKDPSIDQINDNLYYPSQDDSQDDLDEDSFLFDTEEEQTSQFLEDNQPYPSPPPSNHVLATSQDYDLLLHQEKDISGGNDASTQYSNNSFSINDSPLRRYIDFIKHEKNATFDPPTYPADLELLHMIQKSNAPLSMYEDVQKWSRKAFAANSMVFTRQHLSRTKVIKVIERKHDSWGCYPVPISVLLPAAGCRIVIQTFDFMNAVYSLLTDPVLMREENLDLDPGVDGTANQNPLFPFPPPIMYKKRKPNFEYKQFTDGEMYCLAYQHYCKEFAPSSNSRNLHMPLIIIGQLDKTFIDSKGKLTLEPLKISLHIFKEEVRRHDFAWRPLGYISNQANLPKYKNPQEKARDYQFIVDTVINSLKDFQQKYDVFLWDMVIRGSMVHIAFHPVFGYMIGDNEGHDKTCGKYLNRQNVVRLCRYCSTPLEESDNPFFNDWEYTKGSHVARLVREEKIDQLKEISYHCIENAMQGLKFADPIRGINGATPAERLHVLNHGLFQMIMEYNFGQKRSKLTQKKIMKVIAMEETRKMELPREHQLVQENEQEDSSNDESDYEDSSIGNEVHESVIDKKPEGISSTSTPSPLSNISLFTPSICDQFDADARKYGRILQKQSSRYWKRSFFYHGVTNNSRKVGHEERNCLLLCLLIYTSSRYEHYSNTLDPEKKRKRRKCFDEQARTKRLDYLIELLSETLLIENFMMQKVIPKSTVDTLEKYIPLYLSFLKDVCPRQAGMGWKLTKFHVLNHLASDIKRLSIPMNFDSNVVESHHKEEKKSGNRTQKRASLVDKQTAIRRTEEMLIDRAYYAVYPPPSLNHDNEADLLPKTDLGLSLFSAQKLSYVKNVGICYVNRNGRPTKKVARFAENDYILHQINSFFEKLFANAVIPGEGVPIYTRMKVFKKKTQLRGGY